MIWSFGTPFHRNKYAYDPRRLFKLVLKFPKRQWDGLIQPRNYFQYFVDLRKVYFHPFFTTHRWDLFFCKFIFILGYRLYQSWICSIIALWTWYTQSYTVAWHTDEHSFHQGKGWVHPWLYDPLRLHWCSSCMVGCTTFIWN